MRKNFNSVQMLETSEVCNKFSKSVSYETLVGGTTTIGRGIKQTQRLSKGSANKPLTTVGTLTSLLCNSAKVVEKFLQISHALRSDNESGKSGKTEVFAGYRFCKTMRFLCKNLVDGLLQMLPVFRLVKVLCLVAVLSVAIINESRAECIAQEVGYWSNGCYDTWNPGKPDNCGAGCTYDYSDGKLTVTATKSTAVIPEGMFSSYYYNENVLPNIDNIEIVGEFDTIGKHAFVDNSATISGKDDVLYVNNVGHNAFGNDNNTITGTVVLSDKQTSLNNFLYTALLEGTLIIPPTITEFTAWDVYGLNLGENAKIYCGAENCEELFRNVNCNSLEDEVYETYIEHFVGSCQQHLSTLLSSGKLLAYPDGCTKMGATGCTKCKNSNFKLNDGECDRLRWTPAEAAKVLTDDNNNSVTITFKK